MTVVGGGDTGSAAEQFYFNDRMCMLFLYNILLSFDRVNLIYSRVFLSFAEPCSSQITHVSTGGGSSLVLMEGKDLPGVTWLTEKQ